MIKDKKSNSLINQNKLSKDEKKVIAEKSQVVNSKKLSAEQNVANNNDTFFDKFDKTKKDHKEKIKKLKQKKKVNSGILSSFDKKLKSSRYIAKVYGIIGAVSAIVITLGVVIFVLLFNFFNGVPAVLPTEIGIAENFYKFLKDIQFHVNVNVYKPLLQTTVIFSMTAAALVFTPIIYMISSWFVGINNIHQEKRFVIAYWSILAIAAFLLLAALIFLFALGWGPFGPFNYPSQPIA